MQFQPDKPIIFFDGVCSLCNAFVIWVIKHDKKDYFRFAAFQSEAARLHLRGIETDFETPESIILSENGKLYFKSTAVLRIAYGIGGAIAPAYVFFIVPAFIRDWVYKMIARNRYRWFGKKDKCMVPTEEIKAKFIT